MKDFFNILNDLLQAYIVLCTSLLFKEKMDNFLNCSEAILFLLPGLPGWAGKRDYMENFQPGLPGSRLRDTGISANRAGAVVM